MGIMMASVIAWDPHRPLAEALSDHARTLQGYCKGRGARSDDGKESRWIVGGNLARGEPSSSLRSLAISSRGTYPKPEAPHFTTSFEVPGT
jgi:hypothetical protein